jgi:uncharacterized protein (TIGR02646 family)
MHRLVRKAVPECLTLNLSNWTSVWVAKVRAGAKSDDFSWRNTPCEKEIREKLGIESDDHCCFCDKAPLDPLSIDHFRPKMDFPADAYCWENLYSACLGCQGRNAKFNELAIRPDEPSFTFDRFFDINADFDLIPNGTATAEDQERALVTIELFKLNRLPLRKARRMEFMQLFENPSFVLYQYRYLQASI